MAECHADWIAWVGGRDKGAVRYRTPTFHAARMSRAVCASSAACRARFWELRGGEGGRRDVVWTDTPLRSNARTGSPAPLRKPIPSHAAAHQSFPGSTHLGEAAFQELHDSAPTFEGTRSGKQEEEATLRSSIPSLLVTADPPILTSSTRPGFSVISITDG